MIRILQGNMHRSLVASDLLLPLASEKNVDLLLLSEQYRNRVSPSWYADLSGTAAIWVINTGLVRVKNHGSGDGFVWVHFGDITVFSVYLTPNEPAHSFRERVDRLEDAIVNAGGRIVVGGDFNARGAEWGMSETDPRGRYLLEMAARTGLTVLNVGNTTTFRRPGNAETIPDVSFATENVIPSIRGWKVLEDYTGSDHQYILFAIESGPPVRAASRNAHRRWNVSRVHSETFTEVIGRAAGLYEDVDGRESVEALVAYTMALIESACDASMPRKTPRHSKPPVYWWTEEISYLRKRCLRLRRTAQRARNRDDANERSAEHRLARRELRHAIHSSKAKCWRELVEDVDRDPWGLGYKLVTQRLGALRTPCAMDAATMERIVGVLFPTHPIRNQETLRQVEEFQLFTAAELERAVRSMKDKKAPGPDGIPSEVLKMVYHHNPEMLLRVYNACLKVGVFPSRWKVARLVLVSKGKGDPDSPSAYRPLCMLDTAGKLLERLIKHRLKEAVHAAGDLSPRQYGFRSGRSTVDAVLEVADAVRRAESHNHFSRRVVLLVTLDVRNAFNSARWEDMLGALEHTFSVPGYLLRLMEDYLSDRALIYETNEGQQRIGITSGAAQGSILGPDLWNVAYDSLLRTEMPDECLLVGYADDVAALVAARTLDQAQIKLNMVMLTVLDWMSAHGLSLALQKTEVVVLTKKRIPTIVPVRVGGEVVTTKPATKYLGLMIDTKLSFSEQIRVTARKAAAGVTALSRLMANVGGPSSSKRRLLMSAVQSVLLYGSEIWAVALNRDYNRKQLLRVQRRGALRVASAYRTVSEPAVLVIAGVIPIHLLARERRAIFLRKVEQNREAIAKEERTRTLQVWQQSWEEETRGRWTATLIPEIEPWLGRQHGEIEYYVTQLLSGHGYFRSYLHKVHKAETSDCMYCPGALDDACHTFFQCDRWQGQREELFESIGVELHPQNIVATMLRGADSWSRVAHYTRAVLQAKKADLDRL